MMIPPVDFFGLHLILVPYEDMKIPLSASTDIEQSAEHVCSLYDLECMAVSVRTDHVHLLARASAGRDVSEFVAMLLDRIRDAIANTAPSYRGFQWDDAVHVTLLPPWHVEILASFVRDQDRYHATRSLEDELNEVFRPNAIGPEVN